MGFQLRPQNTSTQTKIRLVTKFQLQALKKKQDPTGTQTLDIRSQRQMHYFQAKSDELTSGF